MQVWWATPSAFCPLIHSSYNAQHIFKYSTFFPPKFLSTLSNCSQVLRLQLKLSWLLKRRAISLYFPISSSQILLFACTSWMTPCSTRWLLGLLPHLSAPFLSASFWLISHLHFHITLRPTSPWPHIPSPGLLTLSSLSSDFLPHPQGSITSSPPLCHSSSSPAPHLLTSPSSSAISS